MRLHLRRILLAVLVTAGTVLAVAAPADAGGPTSVMLTNPDQGRAAAIYYSDPRYTELDLLMHGTANSSSDSGPAPNDATYLNVTWLAHDVSVWRTDSLRLDPSGDAWLGSGGSGWAQLEDGEQIHDLARSLGLIGAANPADTQLLAETVAPEAPAPAPEGREETRWFSLTGWRWAVPGLLVGLMAAALIRGRRIEPMTPRRELIDGTPERLTSPG